VPDPLVRVELRSIRARSALAVTERLAVMTSPSVTAAMQTLAGLTDLSDQVGVLSLVREIRGELATTMAIEVTEFTPERVVATMPVAGNRQPYGLLHGGASAALAETLGSFHGVLIGRGKAALGLELSCTHHRSATDGVVTGVCMPISVGRTMSTFEIVVSDEAGRRLCTARLTVLFREAR
jgi:1,4-dihydroxy-2-naphthoyl-CoA hydrolase